MRFRIDRESAGEQSSDSLSSPASWPQSQATPSTTKIKIRYAGQTRATIR